MKSTYNSIRKVVKSFQDYPFDSFEFSEKIAIYAERRDRFLSGEDPRYLYESGVSFFFSNGLDKELAHVMPYGDGKVIIHFYKLKDSNYVKVGFSELSHVAKRLVIDNIDIIHMALE